MAKKIKVDFSGVPKEIRRGGKSSHVPEGDYLGKIVSGELKKTKDKSGRYFSWRVQVTHPKAFKGKTLWFNTSLKPDALWNLRNLIYAITGKNVSGKALGLDVDTLLNKPFAFTAVDDEYEGKMKSVVEDVRPKAELKSIDDDDEDEEEDEEEGDEDEEEEEDEDLDDVDVEDL